MLVGHPLYVFRGLRAEAARVVMLYEPFDPSDKKGAANLKWLEERERAYQACGAQLVAFAATQTLPTWLLWFCHRDPRSAGEALIALAGLSPGQQARAGLRDKIVSALRLSLIRK